MKILERTAFSNTLLALAGVTTDAVSHDWHTGLFIPEVRRAFNSIPYIGTVIAEHSGNITQSMGPAILVTYVSETLRDYAKSKDNTPLEIFADAVEIVGLFGIALANNLAESYKNWPLFLMQDANNWESILSKNLQFNGDFSIGLISIMLGFFAAKGVMDRIKSIKQERQTYQNMNKSIQVAN